MVPPPHLAVAVELCRSSAQLHQFLVGFQRDDLPRARLRDEFSTVDHGVVTAWMCGGTKVPKLEGVPKYGESRKYEKLPKNCQTASQLTPLL